jgi:hypothetical protein
MRWVDRQSLLVGLARRSQDTNAQLFHVDSICQDCRMSTRKCGFAREERIGKPGDVSHRRVDLPSRQLGPSGQLAPTLYRPPCGRNRVLL